MLQLHNVRVARISHTAFTIHSDVLYRFAGPKLHTKAHGFFWCPAGVNRGPEATADHEAWGETLDQSSRSGVDSAEQGSPAIGEDWWLRKNSEPTDFRNLSNQHSSAPQTH